MSEPLFDFLNRGYQSLRQSLASGRINQQQFQSELAKLRGQDSRGAWWTVDEASGRLLCYDGQHWVAAGPPAGAVAQAPAQNRLGPQMALAISIGMPLFFAFLYFCWASIRASYEGLDCLTPLIMGGVPVLFIVLHNPLDRILMVIQPVRRQIPKPLLWGIALGLPIVLGLIGSSLSYSGLGAMRFSMLVGMLASVVLLRNPAGQS